MKLSGAALVKKTQVGNGEDERTFIPTAKL
jgi:hypothetical protein